MKKVSKDLKTKKRMLSPDNIQHVNKRNVKPCFVLLFFTFAFRSQILDTENENGERKTKQNKTNETAHIIITSFENNNK